mmetsp:Transcript_1887/g.4251  ORF Transcript_1887/g.4251 Transcript_1887/m.4251 type:complete len:318 (-) Transcript_1887:28-981(-)
MRSLVQFLAGCAAVPVMNTTLPKQEGFEIQVFAPAQSAQFPVVFFVGGLSADVPVKFYSDLLNGIASSGYVIVGLGHLAIPNYPKQGRSFHQVMQWAEGGGLTAALAQAGVAATVDLTKAAVMAQSAGNHVAGQGLADGCSLAKGFIMIDPVDGVDPFGIIHTEDLITPGRKLNFTIPALQLDNALDPVKAKPLFPACAPAKLSGDRWYNAMAGPVWNVHAANYGHVDCLDDGAAAAAGLVCKSDPTYPNAPYKAALADAATLFLRALFNGETANFAALEDAAHFGVNVTTKADLKGQTHAEIRPGCVNTPSGTVVV